jgi:hypothetical protein
LRAVYHGMGAGRRESEVDKNMLSNLRLASFHSSLPTYNFILL